MTGQVRPDQLGDDRVWAFAEQRCDICESEIGEHPYTAILTGNTRYPVALFHAKCEANVAALIAIEKGARS